MHVRHWTRTMSNSNRTNNDLHGCFCPTMYGVIQQGDRNIEPIHLAALLLRE